MFAHLYRSDLHYGGSLQLHTASSGPVAGLDTLHLQIKQASTIGTGEVRINIAYLNGLSANEVLSQANAYLDAIDWQAEPEACLAELHSKNAPIAPVRMLLDTALHDLLAKKADRSVAVWLGADHTCPIAHATNQTLFISTNEQFEASAKRYIERGFYDLKVRIGTDSFSKDFARIKNLRDSYGDKLKIAADVNGCWDEAEARTHLKDLAPLGLAYIEQPIAKGNWDALYRLGEESPIPLMLDESMSDPDDVDKAIKANGKLWAHVKLVKMGGIAPTLAATRKLRQVDIPFMIGQMNEGSVATAAALHLACATGPQFAELYGADGLLDDPASGLTYSDGAVLGQDLSGYGLSFDTTKTHLIREFGA